MKSCLHLQKSIYLAPKEIRACCQRFFVNDEMKGDVVVMTPEPGEKVSYNDIIKEKARLIAAINNGESEVCTGCPMLKDDDWPDVAVEQLQTISIEDHSLCNMKCTYCSDDYYGGIPPSYDTLGLLNEIATGRHHSPNLHIAWGGGEPTIRKDFGSLFQWVNENLSPQSQRVFSNALTYSRELQTTIDRGKAYLTTSIDAGLEETFRLVRGNKGLNKVLRNLAKYSELRPDHVTIKYIFTEDNASLQNLTSFRNRILEFGLSDCDFLLSTDFKEEYPSEKTVTAIIELYIMLFDSGVKAITLDEHVLQRVRDIGLSKISQASPDSSQQQYDPPLSISLPIIIWGSGSFAEFLISTSKKIKEKKLEIVAVVDADKSRQGWEFFGHRILSPDEVHRLDGQIAIASSNFYGKILRDLISRGIDKNRVMPNFLL